MKRFYKSVDLVPVEGRGYSLTLDKKAVQTPARNLLVIGRQGLAEAVQGEWSAQGETVQPESMPLSQLSMTLIDRVLPNRPALAAEALGYLDTDLLCYRADEPEVYRKAQEKAWDPALKLVEGYLGCSVQTTSGLAVLEQSEDLHRKIADFVEALDHERFMALYLVTLGSGSLLLAIGFVAGLLDCETVINAAFAEEKQKDEIYLGEIYGSAPDQEKRMKALSSELSALSLFMSLTKEQK